MSYDKALIAGKLRRWEKHLMRFRLPEWDEIPDFGLYMEQTVDLLRKYLDYLPPELKNEEVVTSSAINNYVRRGIMPGPIKKKYYRPHIACLLMICTLKQSLNMSMIKIALPTCECSADARCDECAKSPVGSAENSCTSGVRSAYESFIRAFRVCLPKSCCFWTEKIFQTAEASIARRIPNLSMPENELT